MTGHSELMSNLLVTSGIKITEVIIMKGKSFLVGFLIGGAAAGISTLLTVPNSGKNTRMNMKDKYRCLDQTIFRS